MKVQEYEQSRTSEKVSQHRLPEGRRAWEKITIDGERFFVIQGLKSDVFEGNDPTSSREVACDIYQHEATGMNIQVWKVGMDSPQENPAIVRLDYGCPCMHLGPRYKMRHHPCQQERDTMVDTMMKIGIGAMVTISEDTASGNGHGFHAVFEQADIQRRAARRGDTIPSPKDAYSLLGYYPTDERRHDIVASTLAHSIGRYRPVIPTTGNPEKIAELKKAGLNVMTGARVELVTAANAQKLGKPENTAQLAIGQIGETPRYIEFTKQLYDRVLARLPRIKASLRRN